MPWASLNNLEKQAGTLLGYTQLSWDDKTTQPASFYKKWIQLTNCGGCEISYISCSWPVYCSLTCVQFLPAGQYAFLVYGGANWNASMHLRFSMAAGLYFTHFAHGQY